MQRRPHRSLISFAAVSLSVLAAACGGGPPHPSSAPSGVDGFPMTINADGKTFTFDHRPKVLVDQYESVYPVAAAGGNRTGDVVAVTGDANEQLGPVGETLANVPRLATFQVVSKEVIIGQRPDLVITHGFSDDSMATQLADQGIKTIKVNVCWDGYAAAHGGRVDFDAIYDDVTKFGRLLGTEDYAARSVDSMRQTVASVQQKVRSLPKRTVAITAGLYSGSYFVYGPPSIVNTQIEALGQTNAYADLTKRGEEISPEAFVSRNPDFLVLGYDPVDSSPQKEMQRAMAVPGFSAMKAVQDHHVLVLSDTYLLGRAVDGLQMMYDAIAAAP